METQEQRVVTTGQETAGTVKTRRVGSVTFGLTLIVFGVLFLVHMAAPSLNYEMIFNCWPVVFVLLGVEILVENRRSNASGYKFVYDFPAILMLVLMLFFAMMMAVVDYAVQYHKICL
ncbi:MAG: DUF5668 domain-containing protein [Lachnospiraceae bacterium]|nr:DUF5668 domain-containing protein [Lachnospiraceae bacterium]